MAKANGINLFERHVEKGVLGVCGLFLIYVLFHWVFSSPRRVEVMTGEGLRTTHVSPDGIDNSLLRAAENVAAWNTQATPTPATVTDWPKIIDALQRLRKPQEELGLPDWIAQMADLANLGDLLDLAVGGPKVTPTGRIIIIDEKISLALLEKLAPPPGKPKVNAGREVRKARKAGAEDESDEVEPLEQIVAHVAAVYPLAELKKQWSQKWRSRKPGPDSLEIVVLGAEVVVEESLPDGKSLGPRPAKLAALPKLDRKGKVIELPKITLFDGSNREAALKSVKQFERTGMERVAEPDYWDIWDPPTGTWCSWRVHLPHTSVANLAAKVGAVGPAGRKGAGGPPVTPHPSIEAQIKGGKLLVWAHHAGLAPKHTYRYRVRLKLWNPLYTYDTEFKAPADATKLSIYTPLSLPSDPVRVEKGIDFFVTSSSRTTRALGATVFSVALGQQVSSGFSIREGALIGEGGQQVEVISPIDGKPLKVLADFATGATAVELHFDKPILLKGRERKTVEVLYLDDDNRLRTCVRAAHLDRDSAQYKRYRQLSDDAKQTQDAVRKARAEKK